MTYDADHDVYRRKGFGTELGLRGNIGLLMIDFVNGFANPAQFGGGNIAPAIERSRDLLAQARTLRWPVAHSRIVFAPDGADANVFAAKVPGLLALTEHAPASAIVDALAPVPGELVVRKTTPSAFFGTPLAAWLTAHGAWRRHARDCWLHDERMRARKRRRRHVARLSPGGRRRLRRRPGRGPASRQPVRPPAEVRGHHDAGRATRSGTPPRRALTPPRQPHNESHRRR